MTNHALFAISRMISRNNIFLLNAVFAYAFLLFGLEKKSRFWLFIGGAVAGLSFYQYPPAMLIFPLWLSFMFILAIVSLPPYPIRRIMEYSLVATLGFIMVAGPNIVAHSKLPQNTQSYGRQQLLIYPEGRLHQQSWYGTKTIWDGIKRNMQNGFFMFNAPIHDQAYIYDNYGHGFIDPLSGLLLWAGIILTLFRNQKKLHHWFFLSGFFFLWLVYLFVTGETPNYTRMFIILPFIIFFIAELFIRGDERIKKFPLKINEMTGIWLFGFAIFCIMVANVAIFRDFALKGLREGNDVGSTGRYMEERASLSGYTFYIAADAKHPYYRWGNEGQWRSWAEFFKGPTQDVVIINPEFFIPLSTHPFTIFLSRVTWMMHENTFRNFYPNMVVREIKKDGSLLAVEVIK